MELDDDRGVHVASAMPVDDIESSSRSTQENDIPSGATCRICRGDGTDDNPLFHPCKCKGSIKYIHESCLMEWISSKNVDISKPGTTADCDICHYPINFRTTYAENMPDSIPISLLLKKSLISCFYFIKEGMTLSLAAVLFVVGIPLTWNFFGKLYTMILDGEIPYSGDFYKSVSFGYRNNVPRDTSYLVQCLLNYRFSMLQIVMIVILHISLYFQYDMIVRESVFSKMVFHKIGPQYNKEELVRIQLKERFPMMDDETVEHVAKLMRAREDVRNGNPMQGEQHLEDNDNLPVHDNEAVEVNDGDSDSNGEEVREVGDGGEEVDDIANNAALLEEEIDIPMQRPLDAFRNQRAQNQFDDLLDQQNAINRPNGPIFVPPGRHDEDEDLAPPMVNAEVEDDVNQQVPPPIIINLKLKLINVIAYYIVAVVLVAVYLAIAYLLPSFVGFGLIKCYVGLTKIFCRGLVQVYHLLHLPKAYAFALSEIPHFTAVNHWIMNNIIDSWVYYYNGYNNNSMKSSILVRSIPALVSYVTAITIVSIASELICKGFSRENGMKNRTRRFIFQILFAIKCTFKVFTLFFIELAGFPVLAGLMLDFSLFCPLLSPGDIIWAPQICEYWPPFLFFVYWTIGTLYMYWFAKYIGMIRQHIIRPGVLFFIRSPDDPNIKILHDSLIHPMNIQISRLCLSMFIYAVFIIIGFGFHTRFLFPVLLNSKMLTTSNLFVHKLWAPYIFVVPFYITKQIVGSKPSVKLYIRKYWVRAFDVSAKKLRLSSFILGTDIPTERGHIHYRNLFYKFFASKKAQWSNPELFTAPKTLTRAEELFHQNKAVHAYFIPDGILMRVPSSDIVSRNYVQTLFVPVTKDDKLLKPLDLELIKERNKRSAGYFGYLDEQNTEFDGYSIVYTPPKFRLRYTFLIVFVWLFASLLVLLTAISCQYIVTSLLAALSLPLLILPSSFKQDSLKGFIKAKYQQLDIFFVCGGAVILSIILEAYHQHKLSNINLRDHIIPVVDEGADTHEPVHNDNRAERIPMNPVESWGVIIRNILNRGEIKVTLYSLLLFIMTFTKGLAIMFNIQQLKAFAGGYFSPALFREPKMELSPWLLNGDSGPISIIVVLASMDSFWNFSKIYANNRNRSFYALSRVLLKEVLRQLSFILHTTLPLVVSWLFFSSLEFVLHQENYTSFGAAMRFLWRYRLLTESDAIPWTAPQHLCYLSIYIIMITYVIWQGASAAKKWFGVAIQNVKDEVYAKGRSLENFPNSDG